MAWRSRLKALVPPTLAAGSVFTLREQANSEGGLPLSLPKRREVEARSRREDRDGRQKVNSKRIWQTQIYLLIYTV